VLCWIVNGNESAVPGRTAKIFHFFCDRPLKGEGSRKVLKIVNTEDILWVLILL
jgi:hypothetical protein